MNRATQANIGGFYPMNQYRFVPNKQAPIIPAEAPLPVKLCSGTPIAALHTPLPPVVNATFVPNVPLTKDERELREYNVEVEREAKAKKREQEFIYELQGRVNTDERQKDDYKNLIERKITELAGSNMPMADKVLAIQELMTSADRMGLNPQVASPMLLEALERFGMAAGFGGIVDQLRQNQALAEGAPQQPLLHAGGGFGGGGVGNIGDMLDTTTGYSIMNSLDGGSAGLIGGSGGSGFAPSAAYSDISGHPDPAEYYASIAAQAVARPGRRPGRTPPRPQGIAVGGEVDGGGAVRSVSGKGESEIRGSGASDAAHQDEFARAVEGTTGYYPTGLPGWAGRTDSSAGALPAPLNTGGAAGALPVPSSGSRGSSRFTAADMLQHGQSEEEDADDFGAMLRRMRRRRDTEPARPRGYGFDG